MIPATNLYTPTTLPDATARVVAIQNLLKES